MAATGKCTYLRINISICILINSYIIVLHVSSVCIFVNTNPSVSCFSPNIFRGIQYIKAEIWR